MKKFNTVKEITSDPIFILSVKQEIEQLKKDRKLRPIPNKGYRYKRDWYDIMTSKNQLNPDFIISEAPSFWAKKSNLNVVTRKVLGYILEKSMQKTLVKYKEIEEIKQ